MAANMRGLTMFIGDIRNCALSSSSRAHELTRSVRVLSGKTKEAEQRRVDKELAHIREQARPA